MKKLAIALGLVVAVAAGIWSLRGGGGHPGDARAGSAGAPASTSSPGAPSSGAPHAPPRHVIRLAGPAQRAEVAARIAAAHAARAASTHHEAPAPPSLPPLPPAHELDLEHAPAALKDALHEAIPYLSYCYREGDMKHDRTAAVDMTLTGDPDVGTLIDPDRLADPDGNSLDPDLEGCLRTTLESLELPPLAEGDQLRIEYSFRF